MTARAREVLASPLWDLLDHPVVEADCREAMAQMPAGSIDAIASDPPYGLEFMGKDWDRPWAVTAKYSVGYDGRDGMTLPSHRDGRNANCRRCGGRARGANRCACASPLWDRAPAQDMRDFQAWCETWAVEAFRVLKPGGHLLAFGGTRTYHRLASALEDAGFELRDTLMWFFGSGFPKSLDVSKAIDKAAGAEREIVGEYTMPADSTAPGYQPSQGLGYGSSSAEGRGRAVTAATTPEAEAWEGWGTALKPGYEPIVLARKPLIGGVVGNVLAHGTGALHIDACRIDAPGGNPGIARRQSTTPSSVAEDRAGRPGRIVNRASDERYREPRPGELLGRWPANVVLSHTPACRAVGTRSVVSNGHYPSARPAGSQVSGPSGHGGQDDLEEALTAGESVEVWECHPECPVALLDGQSGVLTSGSESAAGHQRNVDKFRSIYSAFSGTGRAEGALYGDSGGASRFYYCAKTSTAERSAGLDGENEHPTVKPIEVMRWLIRLVTPDGGIVLDPFAGSGTTGCAAALEGVRFVGIENDPASVQLARQRIGFWASQPEGVVVADVATGVAEANTRRAARADAGQLDLLAS